MADNYEFLYDGAGSSLEPETSEFFIGYRFPIGRIGAPTSPQTANQLGEVSARLSEGMKIVELSPLQMQTFETIPKQHLKEINRLTKLTGSEVSIHAPIIDPAGFTDEGWQETGRETAEREIWNVVERSHQLNPQGNVPITIHASAMPAAEYKFIPEEKKEEKEMLVIVNQETGRPSVATREEVFYPGMKEAKTRTAEEYIDVLNDTEWMNSIRHVVEYENEAKKLLSQSLPIIETASAKGKEELKRPEVHDAIQKMNSAQIFLESSHSALNSLSTYIHEYGTEEQKAGLLEVSKKFVEDMTDYKETGKVSDYAKAIGNIIYGFQEIERRYGPPQLNIPLEEFALEKASETLGNVAFKSYREFKDKAPLMNIENVLPGMALSRAEELKKLIEESRKRFVDKAIQEGYSASDAKQIAEKMIGATWDVGHINILRKSGFPTEKIVEETKKIAPFVKHLHLTDNFGFEDSHLPLGMGEVPAKEMLKELEKAGFKGKAIAEAGGLVAQFKTSPHPYVLEALGSPLYSAYMQPFWSQLRGTEGIYSSGYGLMLPEQHFSMYGGGFSALPSELGGQVQSGRSRLAGTPME